MDPQLIEYFGFSQDPFVEGLPGQQFYNPKRKSVLAELHFLAEQGQHLLLVTGPQGSGRSTLATPFLATSATPVICLNLIIIVCLKAAEFQYKFDRNSELAVNCFRFLVLLCLLNRKKKPYFLVSKKAKI